MNINDPRIKTCFIHPPIPIRCFDWVAWIDGSYEYFSANGINEQTAKERLVNDINEFAQLNSDMVKLVDTTDLKSVEG